MWVYSKTFIHSIDSCSKSKFYTYTQQILSFIHIFPQVPHEWGFMKTLDLFFKIHMTFNIAFEKCIAPAMNFIGHYIYGLDLKEFRPTIRIRNFVEKFKWC